MDVRTGCPCHKVLVFFPEFRGPARSFRPDVRLVAHDCGYPLSRYTCRATRVAADFLVFVAFCRCSSGVAPHPPEGPKIKKIRDFDRDWKFRARMKILSEPPTEALFFVGKSRRRDWNFRARLEILIETENFERIFLIVGPSGPLKILSSHSPPPHSREVSHRNLGLKRCRATRGCHRYSCGCRATLCN